MSGIYWLASYPKSGNTWMRIFLTNYWRDADAPADINELEPTPIASGRPIFDQETGIDSADLTFDEIDLLRPHVYTRYAQEAEGEARFCKVHDAYTILPNGKPLFPAEATRGAIYILRNPLDVAVSYAHHNGIDLDTSIYVMDEPDHVLGGFTEGMMNQFRQRLLTWSEHVQSWVNSARHIPVLVVRYEDLFCQPVETFTEVVRFIGGELDGRRIEKAIAFSSFDVLKQQEQEHGFNERLMHGSSFFRKGKIGDWRERLNAEQVEKILHDHSAAMRQFGYLSPTGEIVY